MEYRKNRRTKNPFYSLLFLLLLIILLNPMKSQGQTGRNPDVLHQLSSSLETVTRKISPAVVQVNVTRYAVVENEGRSASAVLGRQQVTGSGVVIDSEGYIITNAHVVANAQRIQVRLPAKDDSGSPASVMKSRAQAINATIIGMDKQIDIALLKAEATGLSTLSFAKYDQIRQGQLVLALGSPQGLENTITMGVISSVARQPLGSNPLVYIQTDAPINPGNSGGPLVDVDGNVVGLNTFIFSQSGGSEGIGFAIPSSIVDHAYQQIRKFGHVNRKVAGVSVQPITPTLAMALNLQQDHGIMVADVLPDGPAETAGLKIQDIIVSADDKPMESMAEFETFLLLYDSPKMKMKVLREGKQVLFEIPVIERRNEEDQLKDLVNQKNLVPQLGIVGVTIDEKIAKVKEDLRIESGVLIAALAESAEAHEIELEAGDVIHSINGSPIQNVTGLRDALNRIKTGSPVALQIERDGQLQFLDFEMW